MKDNRDAIDFANEPVGHIFRQLLVPTVVGMLSIVISIHLSRGEAKAANINATQAFIGCLAITILCCVLILGNLAGTCRLFGSSETLLPLLRGYDRQYVTWHPIDTPSPDFHRPESFRRLYFAY